MPPPPPHACAAALCACSRTASTAAAARITATMVVAGLARPALDLFAESGGAAGGGGGSGRQPCSRCPGLAALTRTTLIVIAALTLVAAVALTVRLATSPPPAESAATPWAWPAPWASAPRQPHHHHHHHHRVDTVNGPATDLVADPAAVNPAGAPPGMEVPAEATEMDAASYMVDNADPSVVEQPALIVLLPEGADGVLDHATDATFDAQLETAAEGPAYEAAADITATTLENAETQATELPPEDGQNGEDSVGHTSATRPLLRGEAGGTTWRSSPSRSSSFRKPFRPRADAAPPAWKQFEGCALHLRPAHHGLGHQHHKRHALLPWPGSTAAATHGLGPLHVAAPGTWSPQRFPQHAAQPSFWSVQAPQQPVWGPAAAQGLPQGASWGQHALQPVMYAPAVQGYQPPLLQLQPGAGSTTPTSPLPGPAWTC